MYSHERNDKDQLKGTTKTNRYRNTEYMQLQAQVLQTTHNKRRYTTLNKHVSRVITFHIRTQYQQQHPTILCMTIVTIINYPPVQLHTVPARLRMIRWSTAVANNPFPITLHSYKIFDTVTPQLMMAAKLLERNGNSALNNTTSLSVQNFVDFGLCNVSLTHEMFT